MGAGWASNHAGWTGRGNVFLPHRDSPVTESGEDSNPCNECYWRLEPACVEADPSLCVKNAMCASANQRKYAVWFGTDASAADIVEWSCLAPGERPISTEELGQLVNVRVKEIAPQAHLKFQPAAGAVTQIPTIFASGQPDHIDRDDSMAGFNVRFHATPTWIWNWGDGESTTTGKPGGAYPDMSVTHTYKRAGTVRVVLESRWAAQFWVAGAGPFSVSGPPVTQTATAALHVRQARAVLSSGGYGYNDL